jgi:hypothetical protein
MSSILTRPKHTIYHLESFEHWLNSYEQDYLVVDQNSLTVKVRIYIDSPSVARGLRYFSTQES